MTLTFKIDAPQLEPLKVTIPNLRFHIGLKQDSDPQFIFYSYFHRIWCSTLKNNIRFRSRCNLTRDSCSLTASVFNASDNDRGIFLTATALNLSDNDRGMRKVMYS